MAVKQFDIKKPELNLYNMTASPMPEDDLDKPLGIMEDDEVEVIGRW